MGDDIKINIGTIGHVDHGKTTLTAAITRILAKQDTSGPHFIHCAEIPGERERLGFSALRLQASDANGPKHHKWKCRKYFSD